MLKESGFEDFTIYERSDGVGGVWRQNTYPGAACDVKSHFYSFSFHLKPDWTEAFAPQKEILSYFEEVADKFDLRRHLRTNVTIDTLTWDDSRRVWNIHTGEGEIFEAHVVISGLGLFNEPKLPSIEGRDQFQGRAFHSSNWDHSYDLTGKRVAVIGTGPTAIQFVPRIADSVRALYVYQRQPGWLLPKSDSAYTERQKTWFRRIPLAARLHRWRIWWLTERMAQIYPGGKVHSARQRMAEDFIAREVSDESLRAKLLPNYPIGCKRMLPTNDWLPTLQKDNVTLVVEPIQRITPTSIVTADASREVDCIIYATGFTSARYLSAVSVKGRDGKDLHEEWSAGVRAFLGMTVPGFPNFFMLYGPNTNGTTSVIHVLEAQVRYIAMMLKRMRKSGRTIVEVKRSAYDSYDEKIQSALVGSVWLGGCGSYFLDEHGKVRTQLPYRFYRYWMMSARLRQQDYQWDSLPWSPVEPMRLDRVAPATAANTGQA